MVHEVAVGLGDTYGPLTAASLDRSHALTSVDARGKPVW
jgi:hypothetical protein